MNRDIVLFGLTGAQRLQEEDDNAEAAFSPHNMFGPNGYGVPRVVPRNPSQGVRRGAKWKRCSFFIWLSMERNRRLT